VRFTVGCLEKLVVCSRTRAMESTGDGAAGSIPKGGALVETRERPELRLGRLRGESPDRS